MLLFELYCIWVFLEVIKKVRLNFCFIFFSVEKIFVLFNWFFFINVISFWDLLSVLDICNGFSICEMINDIVGDNDCCCVWFCLVIIFEMLKCISVIIVMIIMVNNSNMFWCNVLNVFIGLCLFFEVVRFIVWENVKIFIDVFNVFMIFVE